MLLFTLSGAIIWNSQRILTPRNSRLRAHPISMQLSYLTNRTSIVEKLNVSIKGRNESQSITKKSILIRISEFCVHPSQLGLYGNTDNTVMQETKRGSSGADFVTM